MAKDRVLFTEWRDDNDRAKYPFAIDASLTNGDVSIPTTVFLDARLYTPGGGPLQYISKIQITSDFITITISDELAGDVASSVVRISDIASQPVEVLEVRDLYGRGCGVLVTDPTRLGLLTSLPNGEHVFQPSQTKFASAVIVPMQTTGVRGVIVNGEMLGDELWFVGGFGVVLTHEVDPTTKLNRIIVNIVGEPLSRRVLCDSTEVGFTPPTPVEAIVVNGHEVFPDEFGDFKIGVCGIDVDDTVLRVTPSSNSIVFGVVGGRIGNAST